MASLVLSARRVDWKFPVNILQLIGRDRLEGPGSVRRKVAIGKTIQEFGAIFRSGSRGVVGNEKHQLLRGFHQEHAMKRDQSRRRGR